MDRNWVKADRMSKVYKKGVIEFCKYTSEHVKDTRFILCPCKKCLNVLEVDGLAKLEEHLRIHGIDKTYTCWTRHGKKKGEHCSSKLNSNDPFIHREDNNVMVDSDASNYSGDRDDISNVMNEELHDHPDMSERGPEASMGRGPDDLDHVLGEDLPEGTNACYLYLDPGRRYVGRGILHNDLTDRILHGVPLEEEYVRVQFEVAEKSEYNSPLPRPCDEANLVGQAPGYFLAWPRKLVSTKLETPPKIMKKKTNKHDVADKKLEDKQKEKTLESIVDVSSRPLGYPLPEDICHDGVLEFVRLAVLFDRVTDIEVDMGGLYWNVGPWHEHINKENILEVLDAQWLSSSSLVFYIRYLSEVFLSKNPDLAAKFSFVSPHLVSHLVDSSDTNLAKCLLGHIDKDHLLLLPYNVSKHWVLVAVNAKTEMIYYMDPARMTNAINYKKVKALVETAMRTFRTHNKKSYTMTTFQSFRWINVQCPKQALDDGIYCAYYVGCFIEDILCTGETTINVNFSYSPRLKTYPRDKMLRFQTNWAGYMYNRFLKNKLLMK
ncbi:hypothetical protein POM88_023204 [Heracleum sosnowskyi]|uniref:Ubiquitin-like protease family profile domain-containing protein n=1 Tax=Heracleum sosnowskyi TaxID=360622 RepID=A0AAD8II89_9APIA|nr:hypothetical protein POM88_023204 [Heracleum sosnowskyi]